MPRAASRGTVKRSELAGYAAYGYCASHSRYFWDFQLYPLCTTDGLPVDFALAPANMPEREVAAAMLKRRPLAPDQVLATDRGLWPQKPLTLVTGGLRAGGTQVAQEGCR